MNMMPSPMGMGQTMAPPMPSPDQIEQAKLIAEACSWEEIAQVLRTDERRDFTIDIETDATAFNDEEVEKQQAIEFVTAITGMMEKWLPAIQMNGSLAPLPKELAMFAASKFKAGRAFEEIIGDTFDQITSAPPQPNPEVQKMEMEAKAKEREAMLKAQGQQQDMVYKEKEHQLKLQGQQADLAFKGKELEFKERELAMKAQSERLAHQAQQEQTLWDREMAKVDRMFDQGERRERFTFEKNEAAANRAAADEDRRFQREVTVHEAGEKSQERNLKAGDMQARLQLDQDEQRARRAMEADDVKGAGGMTARQEIETSVASQIGQVADAIASLQQNQMQVAEAIQGLFAKQEQTQDALLAAIKRIGAPRNIKRDPKTGRAIGVEILEDAA